MPKKITQQQAEYNVKQKCIEKNYKYKPFIYINSKKTLIPLVCHCGNEWATTSYDNFVNNNVGCPKCSIKLRTNQLTTTQQQAEYNVKQKCIEKNYKYKPFIYINSKKTLIPLVCHCGNEWATTSYDNFVNNNMGCPKCGNYTISKKLTLTQEEAEYNVKQKCIEKNYTFKSFNYVNNRTKISLLCYCGHEWKPSYSDFVNGNNGCPSCSGKNQQYAYINSICDNELCVGLKYGIEASKNTRQKRQNRKSHYNVRTLVVYYFETIENCKLAEKECIKLFQKENKELFGRKGYITKEEMRDGWTETTSVSNIEKIISIYEKWGGIKQ